MEQDLQKPSKMRRQIPQYIATIIANVLPLSYGIAAGWPAIALPLLLSGDSPLAAGPISEEDVSWLASVICLSSVPTSPLFNYISERFGRKSLGCVVALLYCTSALFVIFTNTVAMLYASRVFIGFSVSGTFVFAPIYISEIAEDSVRGTLGVLMTLMVNVGVLFSYLIGAFLSYYTVAWLCLAPPAVFLLCLWWIPETPVYLLRRGKPVEAARSLQWLRGKGSDITPELEARKAAMKAMNCEASDSSSVMDIFASRGSIVALIISFVFAINQQMCGLFVMTSYTVIIFQESGSDLSPNISTVIVGVMLLFGSVIASFLCDHVGRKTLLLVSNAFLIISLVTVGFYFYFKELAYDISSFNWLPVTCLSVYVIGYNIGVGPVPVVIITEIFSPKLVGKALAINGPFIGIIAFIVGKFFGGVSNLVGIHGCFWIFAAFCIASSLFIIAVVPETKNRPLQTILKELEKTEKSVEISKKIEKLSYSPVSTYNDSSVKV